MISKKKKTRKRQFNRIKEREEDEKHTERELPTTFDPCI